MPWSAVHGKLVTIRHDITDVFLQEYPSTKNYSLILFILPGSMFGLASSVAAMLIGGSMYEGGLSNFFVNTVKDYPLLSAMLCGFISSGVITVLVSLCTHQIRTKDDEEREWAKTINIDNPLNPYRLVYEEELKEIDAGRIITSYTMDRIFRKAKIVAVVGGTLSLILFLIVIPSVVLSIEVLTLEQFRIWIRTFQYWCFGATILVVFLPPIEEVMQIRQKLRQNREESVFKENVTDGDVNIYQKT